MKLLSTPAVFVCGVLALMAICAAVLVTMTYFGPKDELTEGSTTSFSSWDGGSGRNETPPSPSLPVLSGGPAVRAEPIFTAPIFTAPIFTCPLQSECIDFTIEENVPDEYDCGDSNCPDYTICMHISFASPCQKISGTISHTCKRNAYRCWDGGDECIFNNDFVSEETDVGDETQCQIVPAGGTAYFLLKDGRNCGTPGASPARFSFTDGVVASCAPTAVTSGSCGNKRNAPGADSCTSNGPGRECVWSVAAPPSPADGCGTDPPPARARSPAPASCTPEQCCSNDPGCDNSGCSDVCCKSVPDDSFCCPGPSGPCAHLCPGDYLCSGWECKIVCTKPVEPPSCLARPTRRSLQEAAAAAARVNWPRTA